MTLNNTTGVQNLPGVVVINRINTSGDELNSSVREFVVYQGTSGSTLTTLTRGIGGSSDQDHAVGSVVEFVPDISVFQSIYTALSNLVDVSNISNLATAIVTLTGSQTLTNKTLTAPNMTSPNVTSGDLKLATGLNIQVNSADPYRTITLVPGFLKPTTTAGCAAGTTIEAGTNDIDYDVLDFDASSDESAYANFQMPDSWDGGAIQFRYTWTNAGGGSAETVEFELAGRALADDDAIDQAVGTAVAVSDTWIAQGDIHTSAWSSDVTLAGGPAAGELVHIEITRDVSDDNLTGDARLISVQLRFKQATYSD